MKEDKLPKMRVYEWDESFYKEIVKDHNYRFGKFNPLNYPPLNDNNINQITELYCILY